MDATKLIEAIADLRRQRDEAVAVINRTIDGLEQSVAVIQSTRIEINGGSAVPAKNYNRTQETAQRASSHLDNVIKVLET